MPPTPIVKVELKQAEYDQLIADLGLEDFKPVVRISPQNAKRHGGKLYGQWNQENNTITVFIGLEEYERDRLTYAMRELTRVILHETRHAWQYYNWGAERYNDDNRLPYRHRKKEIDARDFEDRNCAKYKLATISRKFPSSSMSKLAATERNVRSER
jgi:hypothetical protein